MTSRPCPHLEALLPRPFARSRDHLYTNIESIPDSAKLDYGQADEPDTTKMEDMMTSYGIQEDVQKIVIGRLVHKKTFAQIAAEGGFVSEGATAYLYRAAMRDLKRAMKWERN